MKLAPTTITKACKAAQNNAVTDIKAATAFYQWRIDETGKGPDEGGGTWLYEEPKLTPDDIPLMGKDTEQTIVQDFNNQHRLNPNNPNDARLLAKATENDSPLIIAHDGGKDNRPEHGRRVTAGTAIVQLQPNDNDISTQAGDWEDATTKPLLIRFRIMPNNIGTEETDNNHGKMDGLNMAIQITPYGWPSIKLCDSQGV